MSRTRGLWVLALFVLAGASGCGGAHLVSADANGGVVAIPSNTDYWPFYYREQAAQLMRDRCPNGYQIVKEEEVVVGQTTATASSTDSQTTNQPGGKSKSSGSATATDSTQVSETQNQTEYRITYRKR